MPWFLISGEFDVFFNGFLYDPWFCLGNLRSEPLSVILARFENDNTAGLQTIYNVSPQQLLRQYACPDSQKVYSDVDDLLGLYVARHCGL